MNYTAEPQTPNAQVFTEFLNLHNVGGGGEYRNISTNNIRTGQRIGSSSQLAKVWQQSHQQCNAALLMRVKFLMKRGCQTSNCFVMFAAVGNLRISAAMQTFFLGGGGGEFLVALICKSCFFNYIYIINPNLTSFR